MKNFILIVLTSLTINVAAEVKITDWVKVRFADLDVDGNGSLNLTELRGTTREWMTKAGIDEAEQLKRNAAKLAKLDTDTDKIISIEEFAANHHKNKK